MQVLLRTAQSSEGQREAAAEAVLRWASRKWPGLVPEGARPSIDFEHDELGLEIGTAALPEFGLWGFRVEHTDSSMPGRTWLVEAIVASVESGFDLVGVRSQCTANPNGPPPATTPAFVQEWLQNLELVDSRFPVSARPIEVVDEPGLLSLVALLLDPDRQLPVFVASVGADGGCALDVTRLARRAAGLAHVVRLDRSQADRLAREIGNELAVYGGAVRIYQPGLGRVNDTQVHLNVLPSRIRAWSGPEGTGTGAFMDYLVAHAHRYSVSTPAQLNQLPSFVDLRGLRARRERDEQSRRIEELERNLAGQVTAGGADQLEVLRAKLEERELEVQILQLDKQAAEKKAEEAEALFKDQAEDLAAVQDERDALLSTNASLFAGLERLRSSRNEVEQLPSSYDDIPAWADRTFSARLILLNRARRALKDATFERIELVTGCIALLANEYWEVRTASADAVAAARLALEGRMQALEVDEAPSISPSSLGRFEQQYTVNYQIGFRAKQVLDRHIRGGSSVRDDRFCMRIYFFWDDEKQKVVVGHLPSHLDTLST